jgi:p-methyltransferase
VASEFGEHTLLKLLNAIRAGARTAAELSGVENLVLWTPAGWRATSRAPEAVDLDGEFTRWDVVDEMPAAMVPVRASVGCPHRCEFCDFVAVHPQLRLRSTSSVVEELRLVAARGGTSIAFVDDNSLSSAGRARAMARAIGESGLGLRWGGYLRADRVAPDDADALARSGLTYAWCGIESGDPEMLRRMRKQTDPAAARAGIDALTSAGVHVLATFVLGFPGETPASVDASVAFLNGLRHDAKGAVEYLVFPFHLVPGAPVDAPERRGAYGLSGLFGRWHHATMSAGDVRDTWAPRFFRAVEAGYTYYGGDHTFLWSAARRSQAVAQRKAVTVAFLDGAPDEVVQERFAGLHRTVRVTASDAPDWREVLAPRDRQPGAGRLAPRRPDASIDGEARHVQDAR